MIPFMLNSEQNSKYRKDAEEFYTFYWLTYTIMIIQNFRFKVINDKIYMELFT